MSGDPSLPPTLDKLLEPLLARPPPLGVLFRVGQLKARRAWAEMHADGEDFVWYGPPAGREAVSEVKGSSFPVVAGGAADPLPPGVSATPAGIADYSSREQQEGGDQRAEGEGKGRESGGKQ